MSVVYDGHRFDRYLAVLDERIHSAESGLQGREPISGLVCDIDEDLHAISDSLPLCWGVQTVRELISQEVLNPLTSIQISVTPGGPGVLWTPLTKHGFFAMVRGCGCCLQCKSHEARHPRCLVAGAVRASHGNQFQRIVKYPK